MSEGDQKQQQDGIAVGVDYEDFSLLKGETVEDKIQTAVESDAVVVFGRSTCPFCIEVTRTMLGMGIPFRYYKMDQFGGSIAGTTVLETLKATRNQKTVPFVFINGTLVGGCNETKALIASGEFDTMLGDAGEDVEKGGAQAPLAGVDEGSPDIIGALFEFPNTVDGRVIRWVGCQVFVLCVVIAALSYKEERSYKWLSVGLLTDFCIRFYGGAGISPLGAIAMLITGVWDLVGPRYFGRETGPVWGAGPPKQFAVLVGILFSAIIVILQFTKVWQGATVFAAILAFFAGLEAFMNFCAGCWFFGHAIRLKLIPDTVYMVHINALPETKYTWNEWTKVVNPAKPERVVHQFKDHSKKTNIDLFYKTGKTADWEREDFEIVKHSKIAFQSSVIGVAAIPAAFKFLSLAPRYALPDLIWQILTLLSLIHTVVFTAPYVLKMFMYPSKVRSEWMHPAMNNAFSVPSMVFAIYGFLAWDQYSTALARVLFWIGASTGTLLAVIIVGNWLSTLRHDGHANGAWLMAPVGLYIYSVVGPIIDPSYREVSYLFFGFATIMWFVLFAMLFPRFALGHNADPRMRMFAAVWIAPPAVASIAWTILTGGADPLNATSIANIKMDPIAQALFYCSISMALIVGWMAWRHFLWAEKFFMQMWAFGFPLAALAWAAILYDQTVQTALTKVLATCLVALASIAGFVLTVRTYGGVSRLKVFIPEHKWGPMSQLPLAQDAMREMLYKLEKTAESIASNPGNKRLIASLRSQWKTFATVNKFYSGLKHDTCFPQIGTFFPGHQNKALELNDKMIEAQEKLGELLMNESSGIAGAALKDSVSSFVKETCSVYDYVEDNIKPVVRRYISGPIQKKIMNDCWDDAPPEGWWAALPAVVQNLPMHAQRVTYIRAFIWAMPERCQQFGVIIALGVDPVTWYRIKKSVPEIIPRGESGWKRF
jgi:tellurite resistance protein TehA-like permease/glutaredoxin